MNRYVNTHELEHILENLGLFAQRHLGQCFGSVCTVIKSIYNLLEQLICFQRRRFSVGRFKYLTNKDEIQRVLPRGGFQFNWILDFFLNIQRLLFAFSPLSHIYVWIFKLPGMQESYILPVEIAVVWLYKLYYSTLFSATNIKWTIVIK